MESKLPVELLEHIFHKLDINTLNICRLVCSVWNQEIKSHMELGLIVSDAKDGNLEFSKQVNLPVNLKIFELEARNYKEFTSLKLERVKVLSFKYAYTSRPKIDIRLFSDKCYALKTLKLHRPVLATCDLQEECGSSISPRSLFPNLEKLYIKHVDNYDLYCDGQQVQWTSKNITFLLESIQSDNIRVLVVRLNADFTDINSCVGRQSYRFEDKVLPEFIARQLSLDNLILDVPIYSPHNATPLPVSKLYPSRLRGLDIQSQCGLDEIAEMDGNPQRVVENTQLLVADPRFYDDLALANAANRFWKEFLLAQTQLINVYFTNLANFGPGEVITQVAQNNHATLRCLSMDAHFTGPIHASALKNSKIKKVHICNVVTHRVQPEGEGDCFLKHIEQFPVTINSLNLLNVRLEIEELVTFLDIFTLKQLGFVYTRNHYKWLDDENFPRFLEAVFYHRSLKRTVFGLVGSDTVAEYFLDEWYDDFGMKIRIP